VRPKKRPALIKPSVLMEATNHTVMGVAVGLAFAFLVTHITALGIAVIAAYSLIPKVTVQICKLQMMLTASHVGLRNEHCAHGFAPLLCFRAAKGAVFEC
jgi:hypothetical protein